MRNPCRAIASICIFLASAAGAAGEERTGNSDRLSLLILDLQNDAFQTRKEATANLKQSAESIPAVRDAARASNPEASRRCIEILRCFLHSENRWTVRESDKALKQLEGSSDPRIRELARQARKDSPENIILHLEKLGARFSYRPDNEVISIDLSRQGVGNREVAALHSFRDIQMLDLDYTQITSEVLSTFRNFPHLRELRMRCACLQDEHLQSLQTLSELKVLTLWMTDIGDPGVQYISELHQLEELNLGRNHITDEGLLALRELTELRSLNLAMTDMTDRGLQFLAELPHLKELNVKQTRVTKTGLETILKQRPDLKIHFCRGKQHRPHATK